MRDVLIGCSGFVGSTLLRQRSFAHQFSSVNIQDVRNQEFDLVVCAAAPAQKYRANREPEADWENLTSLMAHLDTIRCARFLLISTVDVFRNPVGVDENTPVDEEGLHPYGRHRRHLEKFVQGRFPNHLVVRLPGLVGTGLRKNVVFDLLNRNNLSAIDSRSRYQFYPMANLWSDLHQCLRHGWNLVHFASEPLPVAEVASEGFHIPFHQHLTESPAHYSMQSIYAAVFGGGEQFQYSKREVLQAIRCYAQSEKLIATRDTGRL